MTVAPPQESELFKPPRSAGVNRLLVLALFFLLGGALCFLLGLRALGVFSVGFGALVGGLALYTLRFGDGAQLVNRALDAIGRGHLADAEALLQRAEARTRVGYLLRIVDLQRAMIALRRGQIPAALARADAALARPLGIVWRDGERQQMAAGHAIRALLRATTGDTQGARKDADEVRASRYATPDAMARAELAEAVVLERSGDRDALRAHLAGSRSLLLEHTEPRERAVVRAYQRMLEARHASVYREGATREPEAAGDQPRVADWMAVVVPAAAPFARTTGRPVLVQAGAPEPAERIDPQALRTAQARLQPQGSLRRVGLVVGLSVLVGVLLAVWQFLSPAGFDAPDAEPVVAPPTPSWITVLLPTAAALGAMVALGVDAHRKSQRLMAALRAFALGDEAAGEAELRALTTSRSSIIRGQAWKQLAIWSERRGDFAAALDACDRAVKAFSKNQATVAIASYVLLPEVLAERAFILEATDRDAEARAEMALIQQTYPSYPFRARDDLRVGLTRRVRLGDLPGAAALLVQGTEDLPLRLRDEALADVVRAAVHPEAAGAGEIDRLKRELRLDAGLRGWLTTVAPAALSAFMAVDQERGTGEAGVETERDAAAEVETTAEQEAAADEFRAISAASRPDR